MESVYEITAGICDDVKHIFKHYAAGDDTGSGGRMSQGDNRISSLITDALLL